MAATLKVRGLRELDRKIEGVTRRARDLSPVLRGRAEVLRSEIVTNSFGKSMSPQGMPWRPLAASTVARRRRGSSKPLIDTGALRGAVTTRATQQSLFFGVSGSPAVYA